LFDKLAEVDQLISMHGGIGPNATAFGREASDPVSIIAEVRTSGADMTARRQSEQFEECVSRRGLVQALTAGATASVFATPSSAQQTTALAEATSADYVRDPTRWGSPEVAALFPGFKHLDMRTKGAVIRLRHGGFRPAPAAPAQQFTDPRDVVWRRRAACERLPCGSRRSARLW
jgi:hypothetical protein